MESIILKNKDIKIGEVSQDKVNGKKDEMKNKILNIYIKYKK